MIASGPTVTTVKWSMADQTVLDDGGARPEWPKQSDHPIAETADLPAPDEGAFDPSYALAHAANATDSEAGPSAGETTPWPSQVAMALPSDDAQLPAPSLQDIGWPVKRQAIAVRDGEPRPSAATDSSDHDRPSRAELRHAELRHAEASHRGRFITHRHARAHPAAGQHASLFSTVATATTPPH